jgi:hypothetical protein
MKRKDPTDEEYQEIKDCSCLDGNWCNAVSKCKWKRRIGTMGPNGGISMKEKLYVCQPMI